MVAQRLVGLLGLQCETADNGEKALERMLAGGIDVVLMDCQMPVKDGYTASTEWRQYETANRLPHLPIIAMTANAMAGDRQKCLDAGMDDYLSKPVDRRLLEATLARWLLSRAQATGLGQSALPMPPGGLPTPPPATPAVPAAWSLPASPRPPAPAPAPAPSPPRPAPTPAPPSRPAPPPFDAGDALFSTPRPSAPAAPRPTPAAPAPGPMLRPAPPAPAPAPAPLGARPEPYSAELRADAPPPPPVLAKEVVEELRAVMGDEYISLVRLFLEDAPLHVRALEAAVNSNDMSRMVAPAHTLKSAAANLGAMALSAAAKRIELGARQGVLPRPAVAVAVLESEFRRASAALQALLRG
jgi:CheY-like chemotaxis protein/HPt (histidine-containing phosphotransfer) domain-containing protein